MEKIEKQNAITLISLTITVIVLIILAGVSFSVIVGENGMIKNAIRSKEEHETAEAIETVQKKVYAYEEALEKENITIEDFFESKYNEKIVKSKDNRYILTSENRIFYIDLKTDEVSLVDRWNGNTSDEFAKEEGTESNPFIIRNAEELSAFQKYVNEGNDCAGKYVMLADDIVLNQYVNIDKVDKSLLKNFEPINGFKGTFDGNNYTIYGLYIESTKSNVGFFSTTSGAQIKNLNISGAYVKGASNVGGVVGNGLATISNCSMEGKIVGTGSYLGGFVGTPSSEGGLKVQNCINYAEVNGNATGTGGITGRGVRGTDILKCGNEGKVNGKNDCGGIMGTTYNWPTVKQCYNKGEVKGTYSVGGICGYAQASIENNYNTGNVICSSTYAGGITGRLNAGAWEKHINCYSTGTVIGTTNIGTLLGNLAGNNVKLFWYNLANNQNLTELSENLNKATGSVNNADVEGKAEEITEEQLLSASFWRSNSYSESIWYLRDGYNPILKWEIE